MRGNTNVRRFGSMQTWWIAGLLWPLSRILGLIAAAPLFGNASVPVRAKLALGILLAIVIAPLVPSPVSAPTVGPRSARRSCFDVSAPVSRGRGLRWA